MEDFKKERAGHVCGSREPLEGQKAANLSSGCQTVVDLYSRDKGRSIEKSQVTGTYVH